MHTFFISYGEGLSVPILSGLFVNDYYQYNIINEKHFPGQAPVDISKNRRKTELPVNMKGLKF